MNILYSISTVRQVLRARQGTDEDSGGDQDQELEQVREGLEEKKGGRAVSRGSCDKVQKDQNAK